MSAGQPVPRREQGATEGQIGNWVQDMKGLARYALMVTYQIALPRLALRRARSRTNMRERELALLPLLADQRRESIDVGANIGCYTEELRSMCSHVHALEAHPRLCRILHGFPKKQVTVRHVAVSDTAGEALTLRVPTRHHLDLDGYSSISDRSTGPSDRMIPVTSITLDEYANHPIGFVKIDIEGHELRALQGAEALIKAQRPRFLVEAEERHRSGAPYDVFRFFEVYDYIGLFIDDGVVKDVSEFMSSMQNVTLLDIDARRAETNYINNFIFIPREEMSNTLLCSIRDALR